MEKKNSNHSTQPIEALVYNWNEETEEGESGQLIRFSKLEVFSRGLCQWAGGGVAASPSFFSPFTFLPLIHSLYSFSLKPQTQTQLRTVPEIWPQCRCSCHLKWQSQKSQKSPWLTTSLVCNIMWLDDLDPARRLAMDSNVGGQKKSFIYCVAVRNSTLHFSLRLCLNTVLANVTHTMLPCLKKLNNAKMWSQLIDNDNWHTRLAPALPTIHSNIRDQAELILSLLLYFK